MEINTEQGQVPNLKVQKANFYPTNEETGNLG